jgi:hypothetical protein
MEARVSDMAITSANAAEPPYWGLHTRFESSSIPLAT